MVNKNSAIDFKRLSKVEIQRLAEEGNAAAQCRMGFVYAIEGLPEDKIYDAALPWMQKSAAQGYAEAQYLLANLYITYPDSAGELASKKELEKLFVASAEQDNIDAVWRLVEYYESDLPEWKDEEKARYWRNEFNRIEAESYKKKGSNIGCIIFLIALLCIAVLAFII